MLNFASDYIEGCHPKILEALGKINMEQLGGYGSDAYTESAIAKIKKEINRPEAKVYFLTGGTQTNQQFVILPNEVLDKLSGKVVYSFWEAYDENSAVVRFATSWATTAEQIRALKEALASI